MFEMWMGAGITSVCAVLLMYALTSKTAVSQSEFDVLNEVLKEILCQTSKL